VEALEVLTAWSSRWAWSCSSHGNKLAHAVMIVELPSYTVLAVGVPRTHTIDAVKLSIRFDGLVNVSGNVQEHSKTAHPLAWTDPKTRVDGFHRIFYEYVRRYSLGLCAEVQVIWNSTYMA
jgi:hypothetical protein